MEFCVAERIFSCLAGVLPWCPCCEVQLSVQGKPSSGWVHQWQAVGSLRKAFCDGKQVAFESFSTCHDWLHLSEAPTPPDLSFSCCSRAGASTPWSLHLLFATCHTAVQNVLWFIKVNWVQTSTNKILVVQNKNSWNWFVLATCLSDLNCFCFDKFYVFPILFNSSASGKLYWLKEFRKGKKENDKKNDKKINIRVHFSANLQAEVLPAEQYVLFDRNSSCLRNRTTE